ncbi:hypothetical protein NM688_g4260 [Phlebia brevispora]|uniref:Uncharacterized protein n=1 Tax=Phlebia brevispora TaxID=194682 RepID=A0ACC1T3E4_9APHY|nr:hypothetical protein NM688_g4260 [Phlebia brevispora]
MSVTGLPTELLYSIIAWITVEYIDDVIVGPLKLPTLPILDQVNPLRELKDEEDPSLTAPNPVLPLFYVSTQFRAVTLKILSHTLDIPLMPLSPNVDRLTIKPWQCIQPIRMLVFKACSVDTSALDGGPLLKPYLMLALINLSYAYFELANLAGHLAGHALEVSTHVGRIVSNFVAAKQLEHLIQPDILRASLSPRLTEAGSRLGTFICIKVLLPMLADSFEQFSKITRDEPGTEDTIDEVRQAACKSFLSQLTLVKTLQGLLVQEGFLNQANKHDVLPICEFLDSILAHADLPGTDFFQCKQLACELRAGFTATMSKSTIVTAEKTQGATQTVLVADDALYAA